MCLPYAFWLNYWVMLCVKENSWYGVRFGGMMRHARSRMRRLPPSWGNRVSACVVAIVRRDGDCPGAASEMQVLWWSLRLSVWLGAAALIPDGWGVVSANVEFAKPAQSVTRQRPHIYEYALCVDWPMPTYVLCGWVLHCCYSYNDPLTIALPCCPLLYYRIIALVLFVKFWYCFYFSHYHNLLRLPVDVIYGILHCLHIILIYTCTLCFFCLLDLFKFTLLLYYLTGCYADIFKPLLPVRHY